MTGAARNGAGMNGAAMALRRHWPEYGIEAAGLGLFMISAGVAWTILASPDWPLVHWLPDPLPRRALMGLAMGGTAAAIIYSPWGRQSGAHLNPAVTLTFLRLRKIAPWDAVFYIIAQCLGGVAGVLLVQAVMGEAFSRAPVEYVVTVPGASGAWIAFLAEAAISFGLMLMILYTSNRIPLMHYTGLCAGLMIALYVTFESPISGMSMNPARTIASALPSGDWRGAWIYFTAPLLGMLSAVDVYRLLTREWDVARAKLNHRHGIDVPVRHSIKG